MRSDSAGLAATPGAGGYALFVAVVSTFDTVRFSAAAVTRHELVEQIAGYVRDNSHEQLWPAHAAEVCALLDAGLLEPAIERYFTLVGERWDDEWLVTTTCVPVARPDISTNAA
jgi:hypothetical protein